MAIDLAQLWDFGNPEVSEGRFRAAMATASPEEALILQTQIARTHGLRRDFARARAILGEMEAQVRGASAQVQVHHALELGRTFASAAHPPESQTHEAKEAARAAYFRALAVAREAKLDGVAVDVLHMLAFVDTAPVDQLRWGQEALALVAASDQPAATRWEASLRNNVGCALHALGRYDEALEHFKQATVLRERGTNPGATRTAHWMIAWTLRALGRTDQALQIQQRLEGECQAAGAPDAHVFSELEILHRMMGNEALAAQYAERKRAFAAM